MDDVYDNFFPQSSSQWDALAHVAYAPDEFYNGLTSDQMIAEGRNGIDHWARRGIAGRGVMLDVYKTLTEAGRPYEPGSSHPITVDDLEMTRKAAGIEFRSGDIVLLNTGFLKWYEGLDAAGRQEIAVPGGLHAPGLEHTEAMLEYVWNSHASAFAADCPALEVCPPNFDEAPFGLLHRFLIAQFGLALGELWWLQDLADECARDGIYEFLVTSAPLNMPGGIGSPANALAIK